MVLCVSLVQWGVPPIKQQGERRKQKRNGLFPSFLKTSRKPQASPYVLFQKIKEKTKGKEKKGWEEKWGNKNVRNWGKKRKERHAWKDSRREKNEEKMIGIKSMEQEEKRNRMGERGWQRVEESECEAQLFAFSSALCSVQSVLSAASLPKSSLTPETWTKLSFGPFVIASKGSTTPLHTYSTHKYIYTHRHTQCIIKF